MLKSRLRWRALSTLAILLILAVMNGPSPLLAQNATPVVMETPTAMPSAVATGTVPMTATAGVVNMTATSTLAPASTVSHPAHIHAGTCDSPGDVAAPLTDVAMPAGSTVGSTKATPGENSFTTVPMTLDALLSPDHLIDVHASAAQSQTVIACGEIGGVRTTNGSLVIGLREQNGSGFSGIAVLKPNAQDQSKTDISVFLAQHLAQASGVTPTAVVSAATPIAASAATSASGMVEVTLKEFTITMPASLPAGKTTFHVTNKGAMTHSFEIEGQGVEKRLDRDLAPGESATLTVDLKAGGYDAYCPIDGHRAQGMEVKLAIK